MMHPREMIRVWLQHDGFSSSWSPRIESQRWPKAKFQFQRYSYDAFV
jgi:hypothetical protein